MAIAQDTITNLAMDSVADPSTTIAHNGGSGTDRVTIGMTYTIDLNVTTTQTYNGVSMNRIAFVSRGDANRYINLFALHASSTGTNNIVASFSPNSRSVMGAVTISGAAQTSTPDHFATNTHSSSATTTTANLVPTVANTWAYGIGIAVAGSPASGTNLNVLNVNDITAIVRSNDTPIASAGAYSMTLNQANGAGALIVASFAPAGAGGSGLVTGTTGGTTSLGALISATGGAGGVFNNGGSLSLGGIGGSGSSGDLNVVGTSGGFGYERGIFD